PDGPGRRGTERRRAVDRTRIVGELRARLAPGGARRAPRTPDGRAHRVPRHGPPPRARRPAPRSQTPPRPGGRRRGTPARGSGRTGCGHGGAGGAGEETPPRPPEPAGRA